MMFIVTVKLPKNPKHDPHNKVMGDCPVGGIAVGSGASMCSDVTGEHHSFLWAGDPDLTPLGVRDHWKTLGYHVTRVEEVLP